jgi:hypothetical protein
VNLGGSKVTKKEVSKGKYADRVGRQDWETFIIFVIYFLPVAKKRTPFPPTCKPHV